MFKLKEQGNSACLFEGGSAAIKTRSHKRLNYGQTVRIKRISGSVITVIPDNDDKPDDWAVVSANELHNNEMSY